MSEFSEEKMLECLETTPPDLTPILGPLTLLFDEDPDTAEAHAKLIQVSLVEKGAFPELITLYMVMSDWHSRDRGWRHTVLRELERAFEGDPLQSLLLELSGMKSPRLKAKAALKRLKFLNELGRGGLRVHAQFRVRRSERGSP